MATLTSAALTLRKTALNSIHRAARAKMVDFIEPRSSEISDR